MKKIICSILLLLSLSACGNESEKTSSSSSSLLDSTFEEQENELGSEEKINIENSAIIYYSLTNNTKEVAEEIQTQTGAEIFEIKLVDPYPEDYDEVLNIVQEQIQNDQLPELEKLDIDLQQYDTLFIGSPIWFGNSSLPVQKWLEENNLAGKNILPFFTSGSSPITSAVNDMEEHLNGITIESPGLGIPDSDRENVSQEVNQWLENIND